MVAHHSVTPVVRRGSALLITAVENGARQSLQRMPPRPAQNRVDSTEVQSEAAAAEIPTSCSEPYVGMTLGLTLLQTEATRELPVPARSSDSLRSVCSSSCC